MKKNQKEKKSVTVTTETRERPLNREDVFLTERPKNMLYSEYKALRAKVNRALKQYLKRGTLVYCASEIVDVKDHVTGKVIDQTIVNHPPFVGSVRNTFIKQKAQ